MSEAREIIKELRSQLTQCSQRCRNLEFVARELAVMVSTYRNTCQFDDDSKAAIDGLLKMTMDLVKVTK